MPSRKEIIHIGPCAPKPRQRRLIEDIRKSRRFLFIAVRGTSPACFPLFPAWRWFCPHRGRQGYSGCGRGPMTDSAPVCCWKAEICMRRKRPSSVLPRNVPRSTRCRGWMSCSLSGPVPRTGAGTAAVLPVRSLRILRKSFLYPAANQKASRLPVGRLFCSYIRTGRTVRCGKKLLL